MRRLKIILERALLIFIASLAIVYCADYLTLRYHMAGRNADAAFGSVVVRKYDAVPLKSGKTEFFAEEPQTEKCVRAIFPHFGYAPCWYLNRHNRRYIPMEITPLLGIGCLRASLAHLARGLACQSRDLPGRACPHRFVRR